MDPTMLPLRTLIYVVDSSRIASFKSQKNWEKESSQEENTNHSRRGLKSGISKDLRNGFSKEGQLILKWTQHHCVCSNICILQREYNSSQVTGKN